MSEFRRLFIVAKNYEQADAYRRRRLISWGECQYVTGVFSLMGLHRPLVTATGEYWLHPEYDKIEEFLRFCDAYRVPPDADLRALGVISGPRGDGPHERP